VFNITIEGIVQIDELFLVFDTSLPTWVTNNINLLCKIFCLDIRTSLAPVNLSDFVW